MTHDAAGYVAVWLWAASAVFVGLYGALWVNRRDVKRDAEAMERRAAQLTETPRARNATTPGNARRKGSVPR